MSQRFDEDSELAIDGLRGLAAMMVLVTHAFDLGVVDVFGWEMAGSPDGWRWARASIGHGGYWVWCFFIISGLCIHRSIARGMAEGTFAWRRYALARLTRIYPLFLLGMIFAGVAWVLHEGWGGLPDVTPWPQLCASLASLQIFTTPFPGYETSWSLSCEMIYYAAWPLLLFLARGRARLAVYAAVFLSAVVLGSVIFTWKVLHRLEHSAAVDGLWTVAVLFPVWICGAWLAAHWASTSAQVTRRVWVVSMMLCLAAEALLVVLKHGEFPGWAMHLASWASVPGLLLLLGGSRHARLSARTWARPVCRWLGQFSYPCYILHMQMLLILNHFLMPLLPDAIRAHPVLDFLCLFLPVLVSLALVGPWLERRVMKWRGTFLRQLEVEPKSMLPV